MNLKELIEKAGFTSLIQDGKTARDPDGNPVFVMSESKYAEIDASLIAHAVNLLPDLVEALELLLQSAWLDETPPARDRKKAADILKQATTINIERNK